MQNVITFSWSSCSLLAFSHTMSTFCRSTDASIYWRQSCSSRESLKFKASLYTSIISNTSCTWPEITGDKNAGALTEQKEEPFSKYFSLHQPDHSAWQNGRRATGVFLWRKKFHCWLDKIWTATRKGVSKLRTPKDFLDKDFTTIWMTIF